jgi:hypothetical protein
VTRDTSSQIQQLDAEYTRNKEVVVGMLLQVVTSIDNPYTGQ